MNISRQNDIKVYRMLLPDRECPSGRKAIELLTERGITFEDIKLRSREEIDDFKAKYAVATTPQIFFGAERIGGYTELADRLKVSAKKPESSYTPVAALFATSGLMAIATSLGMTGFMGFSLAMLASLKLMDLSAFTESFAKYDLITKRFKPYGKVYPFAELAIGLGFLASITPLATGIGSLIVGVSGAISTVKAVYIDKLDLNCACIGGNSKAPLGIVSLAENAIMVGMGGVLILTSLTGTTMPNQQQSVSTPTQISISRY
jgi:glutaredoxin